MARCRPDRIVSEDFDSHPVSGKVNMLDTGELRREQSEDRVGRITSLGESPLPDFPGDKDATTQYCPSCANAADLLTDIKGFLKEGLAGFPEDGSMAETIRGLLNQIDEWFSRQ